METLLGAIIGGIIGIIGSYITFKNTIKQAKKKEKEGALGIIQIYCEEYLSTQSALKQSCLEYISIREKRSLGDVKSIGFPEYKFKYFIYKVNYILFLNDKEYYHQLKKLHHMLLQINHNLSQLLINEIQKDLLNKRVSTEESEIRYTQEEELIKTIIENIDLLTEKTIKVLSQTKEIIKKTIT